MEINNPHDKFFKDSLSRKEVAKDFMNNYLHKWDIGLKLSDMMENISKEIEDYFPDYKYILNDLSDYSHKEIEEISLLKVSLDILTSA